LDSGIDAGTLTAPAWKSKRITISLDASLERLGPGATEAVQRGFAAWLEVTALPDLEFSTVRGLAPSREPDGVNAIIAAPIELPGHEDDLAVTVSFKESDGRIVEADIVLNTRQRLDVLEAIPDGVASSCSARSEHARCGRVYDIENAVAHEVGHFFGLPENATDPEATMFPCINRCETHKRTLAESDRSALDERYRDEAPGISTASACALSPHMPRPRLSWLVLCIAPWLRRPWLRRPWLRRFKRPRRA
jgi:hypothetical protein